MPPIGPEAREGVDRWGGAGSSPLGGRDEAMFFFEPEGAMPQGVRRDLPADGGSGAPTRGGGAPRRPRHGGAYVSTSLRDAIARGTHARYARHARRLVDASPANTMLGGPELTFARVPAPRPASRRSLLSEQLSQPQSAPIPTPGAARRAGGFPAGPVGLDVAPPQLNLTPPVPCRRQFRGRRADDPSTSTDPCARPGSQRAASRLAAADTFETAAATQPLRRCRSADAPPTAHAVEPADLRQGAVLAAEDVRAAPPRASAWPQRLRFFFQHILSQLNYRRGVGLLLACEVGDLMMTSGLLVVLGCTGLLGQPILQLSYLLESVGRWAFSTKSGLDDDEEADPIGPQERDRITSSAKRMGYTAWVDATAASVHAVAGVAAILGAGTGPGVAVAVALALAAGRIMQFISTRCRFKIWNDMVEQIVENVPPSAYAGTGRSRPIDCRKAIRGAETGITFVGPMAIRLFLLSNLERLAPTGAAGLYGWVGVAMLGGLVSVVAKHSFGELRWPQVVGVVRRVPSRVGLWLTGRTSDPILSPVPPGAATGTATMSW